MPLEGSWLRAPADCPSPPSLGGGTSEKAGPPESLSWTPGLPSHQWGWGHLGYPHSPLVYFLANGTLWFAVTGRTERGEKFPLWLSGLRAQHSVREDVGRIPGLSQWVKDLVLLQTVVEVTDAAQIQCCHGCCVGSNVTP